jgi:hypothetical protein
MKLPAQLVAEKGRSPLPQISPLRFAPVELTNLLSYVRLCIDWKTTIYPKQICHLDRSVPGFPTSWHSQQPRMRLSVEKGARSLPTPPSFTGNLGERSGEPAPACRGICGFFLFLTQTLKPNLFSIIYGTTKTGCGKTQC